MVSIVRNIPPEEGVPLGGVAVSVSSLINGLFVGDYGGIGVFEFFADAEFLFNDGRTYELEFIALSRYGANPSHIFSFDGIFIGDGIYFGITNETTTAKPTLTPPPTLPYNLSTASTWAHDGISDAIALGLVPSSLQNHYTNNITRAEFTALAVLLYETATGREITGRVTFNDTTDVNVQKAAYIGVISGTGNNNFSPNMQFNREQAAVMVSRLAEAIGQPLPASSPAFADNAEISSWAREQVGQAQAAGIITGVGDNMFNPRGTFTREQSIILMLRLFEYFS